MRYVLTLWLAVVGTVFLWTGQGEAACRAEGDYQVTGPTFGGRATLTEEASDGARSSGRAGMRLFPRFRLPTAEYAVLELSGGYEASVTTDRCWIQLTFPAVSPWFRPVLGTVQFGGLLAFGGAVIMFEFHDDPNLNLSLGIRSDFILKQ